MTIALAFTQDQTYPFSTLRQSHIGSTSPGVVLQGDMAVSPGSGLQVAISAGEAYIQQTVSRLGNFYQARSLYYVYSDSSANPYNTITAPVSNPRVDQVILRAYDTYEQQLSGTSYARFEWLPGTETVGAQITNPQGSNYLSGAAALPANSLRLAYCLSTVGMASWSSNNIVNQITPYGIQLATMYGTWGSNLGANAYGLYGVMATLGTTANVAQTPLPLSRIGTYLRVRAQVNTNTVAPNVTATVGLYPVTVSYGGSNVGNTYNLGTVVTGSTVSFATPSASSQNTGVSAGFSGLNPGLYTLAVAMSGASTVNSVTDVMAVLEGTD